MKAQKIFTTVLMIILSAANISAQKHDVKPEALILPVMNTCGDSDAILAVSVYNAGADTETVFTIETIVNGKYKFSTSHTKKLAPGQTDTVTYKGYINTYAGGFYSFKTYTALASDSDRTNDTILQNINICSGPVAVNTFNGYTCGYNKVKLVAKGKREGVNIKWYADTLSNLPLAEGDTFTTPFLSKDTVFYASAYNQKLFTSPSIQPTQINYGSVAGGLEFDALEDIYLESVYLTYSYLKRKIVIEVWDSSGNLICIDSSSNNVSTDPVSGMYNLYNRKYKSKGFFIPKGNKYKIIYKGNQYLQIYKTKANYPYQIPGILRINKSLDAKNPTTTYYYFYYWKVSTRTECEGFNRTPARAFVNRDIYGSVLKKDSVFNGLFSSGTITSPDVVCTDNTITYTVNPPSGYTNSERNKKWIIKDVSIQTVSGIKTYDYNLKHTDSTDIRIVFKPTSSTKDSLYKFSLILSNPDGTCPLILERFIKVSLLPQAFMNIDKLECNNEVIKVYDNRNLDINNKYFWDFGDGDISNASVVTHKFIKSGTYKIKLLLKNPGGCSDSASVGIEVLPKPNAKFSFKILTSNKCAFYPVNTKYWTYYWDFGDGTTSNAMAPTRAYSKAGVYKVLLVVTDINNCSDSFYANVGINSIDEEINKLFPVKFYPNPAKDKLNIDIERKDGLQGCLIVITDVAGKEVLRKSDDSPIEISTLCNGVYLVKISEVTGVYYFMFVKE